MSEYSASIVGGSGYTGAELMRLLSGHSAVEVLHVTSRKLRGTRVSERLPNLPESDMVFEDPESDILSESDIVFVCAPHTAAMGIVPDVIRSSRVVDLSADYRIRDRKVYEEVYGVKHTSPELESVYGLPELHRDDISSARLIANPGCYPTGAILALAPVIKEHMVREEGLVIDAKSGSSGAGIKPTLETHHPEVHGSIRPYRVSDHRHIVEMDQELSILAGNDIRVNFTPHLVPISRGIVSTCHVFPKNRVSVDDVEELYLGFYRGCRFIRIRDRIPDLRGVVGSNFCDIGFEVDPRTGRLIIVSAIDNLTKGASGQAVQNMNIMLDLPESQGLDVLGLYP